MPPPARGCPTTVRAGVFVITMLFYGKPIPDEISTVHS